MGLGVKGKTMAGGQASLQLRLQALQRIAWRAAQKAQVWVQGPRKLMRMNVACGGGTGQRLYLCPHAGALHSLYGLGGLH